MSTGHFSTSWTRSLRDVGLLLSFRRAGLRGRSRRVATIGLGVIMLLTAVAALVPAFVPEGRVSRSDVLVLLPSGYIAVLLVALTAAAASGGGRELLPREQAVAFPVSPTTDHLGALLMAPLNIAWLMEGWLLLGATAYGIGPKWQVVLAQVPVLAWLVAATALAQLVAWCVEWVRRGPHGLALVRTATVLLGLVMVVLVATHSVAPLLDRSPTLRITLGVLAAVDGHLLPWIQVVVWLLVMAAVAGAAGAFAAGAVARRPARDELRMESSVHTPRPNPASEMMALVRTDRAGIWRSVPLRRGLAVLAIFPGLVAMAGNLQWPMITVMPGLVASGAALLFGVNSWCLDGRGALWRDSLPVSPRRMFIARVVVLTEVLLLATTVTLVTASLRAGVPTVAELTAVLCATVVVTVGVVATSLRWSVRRPFAVDMRSARATPAPPLVMVGYSSRLALSTTVAGLAFSVGARETWQLSVLLAAPFLLLSARKLARTSAEWADPESRALVIATVAS